MKKIRLVIWLQKIAPVFSNFRALWYLSIPLFFAPLEEKKTLLIILLSKTPRARICLGTIKL